MSTIVTYDISDGHTEVKAQCLAIGFEDCMQTSDGLWWKLPNTTLRHANDDRATVLAEFKKAVVVAAKKINRPITVEKAYLVVEGPGLLESNQRCNGPRSR